MPSLAPLSWERRLSCFLSSSISFSCSSIFICRVRLTCQEKILSSIKMASSILNTQAYLPLPGTPQFQAPQFAKPHQHWVSKALLLTRHLSPRRMSPPGASHHFLTAHTQAMCVAVLPLCILTTWDWPTKMEEQQAKGKQGGWWRHQIALCGVREGTAGRGGAAPAAGHTGCAAPGLGEEDLAEMRKRTTMSQRN